ncbi:MAG: hypothetical protein B7X77_08210, partial [Caulobacter sp. 39-67-4]
MSAASVLALSFASAGMAAEVETAQVDQVIVTAQKRAQDRVEVPIAVTAYSGQFLEAIGVQEFDQLSAFTP